MKILLIEDNPGDARLIKETLRGAPGKFSIQVAERLADGLKALLCENFDVILLDLGLPDSHGLEALEKIQTRFSHLPVVIMTSTSDEDLAVQAVQLGAQDYMVKGQADGNLLRRALLYAIERKKADRIKDEFIGMVSHELRTPLTILTGALGVATTPGVSPEDARSVMDDAKQAAQSLADIVDNLIELARYQANRLALQKSPMDISAVAHSTIARAARHDHTHKFKLDSNETLPPVIGDRMKVELILRNLLDNAIKYSAQGTEIRVSARRQPENLVISVTDKGIGIEADQIDNLFQPFTRLETGQKLAGGLGLGLLVCKHLVEAQGGRIWVESKPGQGSTFSFTMPLRRQESCERAPQAESVEMPKFKTKMANEAQSSNSREQFDLKKRIKRLSFNWRPV